MSRWFQGIVQGRVEAELPEAHNSVENPTITFFQNSWITTLLHKVCQLCVQLVRSYWGLRGGAFCCVQTALSFSVISLPNRYYLSSVVFSLIQSLLKYVETVGLPQQIIVFLTSLRKELTWATEENIFQPWNFNGAIHFDRKCFFNNSKLQWWFLNV